MRKQNGFSMMDLIVTMIVVCLIMGASLPFMTQRAKKVNVDKYGEYICFASPARDYYGDVILSAAGEPTWQLYQVSRYNSDIMPSPVSVDECVFEVPKGINSFNVRLIGGGGGGAGTAQNAVSLNKIYNNVDDENVFNLNNSTVTFENPFEKYNVSNDVFKNKVLSKLRFSVSGASSSTGCPGATASRNGADVGSILKRIPGNASLDTASARSGSMFYNGGLVANPIGGANISPCPGGVTTDPSKNGEITTQYTSHTPYVDVDNYSWSHREDAFKVRIAKGGAAGGQFLTDNKVISTNVTIVKCDATNSAPITAATPNYCVGVGGSGGTKNNIADMTLYNGKSGYPTRFSGVGEAKGGAGATTTQGNVRPIKDLNDNYTIAGLDGAFVPYSSSAGATKQKCTFYSGSYNCNGATSDISNYGAGGSGALVLINTKYLLKNHNIITLDGGYEIDITQPEDINPYSATITTGYGGVGMGGAIIITW